METKPAKKTAGTGLYYNNKVRTFKKEMTEHMHHIGQIVEQLKAHTPLYIELPFNTGDFLLIAHYKLIGNYGQALKLGESKQADSSRRKELHEEVLFQLDKLLSLTSLSEEQVVQLRSIQTLHEKLLHELSETIPDQNT